MEMIELVVVAAIAIVGIPFGVGFLLRMGQSIFSTKAQQAAVEDTNDTRKQ